MQFLCPTCEKRIEVADSQAGAKTQCPHCGQRLQVPEPRGRGPEADPTAQMVTSARPGYGGSAADDDDGRDRDRWRDDDDRRRDDYDEPRLRRRDLRRPEGGGMAIAGLVCGIISAVLFCIPILAWIMGVLGIIFGSIAMNNPQSSYRGMAIAGVCCGIAGIALGVILFIIALSNPQFRAFR